MKNKLFVVHIFILMNIFFLQVPFCLADEDSSLDSSRVVAKELVPGDQVHYEESLSPDWKANWDLARSLYREKKYPEALVQYEILFSQKENIDEARWEYASLLMHMERWEKAKTELEKLLAVEPEGIRYRMALAKVYVQLGNLENAVTVYEKLLELPELKEGKIEMLENLAAIYQSQGKKEAALRMLEQLRTLRPDDSNLLLEQALLELELNNISRARELCSMLEQDRPRDIQILTLQAEIEERANNAEKAAECWEKISILDPDNLEAHRRLYAYYLSREDWAKSFIHLEHLIKATPNDSDLLTAAAELNMHLDRLDRALRYYEYALAVDPADQHIIAGKKQAQRILAKDLLPLVENEEGERIWQDLAKVAPDWVGVYSEIATLLRNKGNTDKLVEILILLNRHEPGDQKIYQELMALLEQQGRLDELPALQTRE